MKRITKGRRVAKRRRMERAKILEHGDIFFFYRPKIGVQEVKDIENVQRFYMVTSPDSKKVHRVFLIGQKQLLKFQMGSLVLKRGTGHLM